MFMIYLLTYYCVTFRVPSTYPYIYFISTSVLPEAVDASEKNEANVPRKVRDVDESLTGDGFARAEEHREESSV